MQISGTPCTPRSPTPPLPRSRSKQFRRPTARSPFKPRSPPMRLCAWSPATEASATAPTGLWLRHSVVALIDNMYHYGQVQGYNANTRELLVISNAAPDGRRGFPKMMSWMSLPSSRCSCGILKSPKTAWTRTLSTHFTAKSLAAVGTSRLPVLTRRHSRRCRRPRRSRASCGLTLRKALPWVHPLSGDDVMCRIDHALLFSRFVNDLASLPTGCSLGVSFCDRYRVSPNPRRSRLRAAL